MIGQPQKKNRPQKQNKSQQRPIRDGKSTHSSQICRWLQTRKFSSGIDSERPSVQFRQDRLFLTTRHSRKNVKSSVPENKCTLPLNRQILIQPQTRSVRRSTEMREKQKKKSWKKRRKTTKERSQEQREIGGERIYRPRTKHVKQNT